MRRWVAGGVVLGLAGCSALLPFGSAGEGQGEGPVDAARRELGTAPDRPAGELRLDLALADLPRADLRPVDLSGPDLRPVDRSLPDCGLPVPLAVQVGCQEADLNDKSCAPGECCAGCDQLPDLPAGRDPWPSTCNTMFVSEPFCAGSLANPWNISVAKLSQSGLLAFDVPSQAIGIANLGGQSVTAEDVVEVRLLPVWSRHWILWLEVWVGGMTVSRGCQLKNDPGIGLGVLVAPGGSGTSLGVVSSPGLVVQSFYKDGAQHCRVFTDTALVDDVNVPGAKPPTGAAINLAVKDFETDSGGLDVEVDYVRAFRP